MCVCTSDCAQLNGDCYSQCIADPYVVTLNCSCLPGFHISHSGATCVGTKINFPTLRLLQELLIPNKLCSTVRVVYEVDKLGRPICLNHRAKFRQHRRNSGGNIAIFDFQDRHCQHLGISKIQSFIDQSGWEDQNASPYQISSKSIKRLRRYRI